MNSPPGVPAATRRAALALHALCDADRAWMLASLSAAHRRLLEPLLDELQRLGLPRDADLIGNLAAGSAEAPVPARVPLQPLDDAQAAHIAAWMEPEPPQLAARLLAACPAWRQRVLHALAPKARSTVERELQGIVPAPALEEFLRAQALQQLQAAPPPRRTAWWKRHAPRRDEVAR